MLHECRCMKRIPTVTDMALEEAMISWCWQEWPWNEHFGVGRILAPSQSSQIIASSRTGVTWRRGATGKTKVEKTL